MSKEEVIHSISNLLFAILILIGLVLVSSFFVRPQVLFEKSRDSRRVEDLKDLVNAINLYLADNKNFDTLETGRVYESNSGKSSIDGSGWVPLALNAISSGAPLGKLPLEPLKTSSNYYRFGVDIVNKTYEFDCVLENGANQKKMLEDGGNNPARYEVGTDLGILK